MQTKLQQVDSMLISVYYMFFIHFIFLILDFKNTEFINYYFILFIYCILFANFKYYKNKKLETIVLSILVSNFIRQSVLAKGRYIKNIILNIGIITSIIYVLWHGEKFKYGYTSIILNIYGYALIYYISRYEKNIKNQKCSYKILFIIIICSLWILAWINKYI